MVFRSMLTSLHFVFLFLALRLLFGVQTSSSLALSLVAAMVLFALLVAASKRPFATDYGRVAFLISGVGLLALGVLGLFTVELAAWISYVAFVGAALGFTGMAVYRPHIEDGPQRRA